MSNLNLEVKETFTKSEKKILAGVRYYGPSMASAGMVSCASGYKVEHVKRVLCKLVARGIVTSKDCSFHENTKLYEITENGKFWHDMAHLN